jgi:hypothetical protein
MDYSYQLFFPREALVEVLQQLAAIAEPTGEPTTLILPDRTLSLPYSTWAGTPSELRWDDPSPCWEFATSLCFEPDAPIRDYLEPRMADDPPADSPLHYDDRGRARIGYVYLTVQRDMANLPSGTGEDLVRLSFGTPGSTMSVLFSESDSIRRTFIGLLESCRGVYGVFDREDPAELFWLRGAERSEELPTAEMTLAEIEDLVGAAVTQPVLSYRADEVMATARHLRRTAGGVDLGVDHWLLALLDHDVDLDLSVRLGRADRSGAAAELRRRLRQGDAGEPLSEDDVRTRATWLAQHAGKDQVALQDVVEVVVDAASGVRLLSTDTRPAQEQAAMVALEPDHREPSFWTPRNSTCDPLWRRTLDRMLMELPGNSGGDVTAPFLTGVALAVLTGLATVVVILLLLR